MTPRNRCALPGLLFMCAVLCLTLLGGCAPRTAHDRHRACVWSCGCTLGETPLVTRTFPHGCPADPAVYDTWCQQVCEAVEARR